MSAENGMARFDHVQNDFPEVLSRGIYQFFSQSSLRSKGSEFGLRPSYLSLPELVESSLTFRWPILGVWRANLHLARTINPLHVCPLHLLAQHVAGGVFSFTMPARR